MPARCEQRGTDLFGRPRTTAEGLSSLALLSGSLLGRLGNLALAAVAFLDRLDHADGDRLTHVADSEAPEGSVVGEGLDAHRLLRHHLHDGCVAGLDVCRVVLELLSATTIDLLQQIAELAGNVGGVTVEHRGIAGVDLTWVIQDDHLHTEQHTIVVEPTTALESAYLSQDKSNLAQIRSLYPDSRSG